MAVTLSKVPPLPVPQEPVSDPRTGLMTRNWYQYFSAVDRHGREVAEALADHETRLTDLETP